MSTTYYRIQTTGTDKKCLARGKKDKEEYKVGKNAPCVSTKKNQVFKLADNKYSQSIGTPKVSYYLHVTANKKTFSLKKESAGALTALPNGWDKVAAADPNGDAGDDDSDDEEFDPPAPAEANEPSTDPDDPDEEDNDNQDKASSWLSKKVGGLARWIWIAIGVGVIFFILIIAMVFMGRRR